VQNVVNNMIVEVTSGKRHFTLTEDCIRALHRIATDGLLKKPGAYRKRWVRVLGSTHMPPNAEEVPALMNDCCRYVNDNWLNRDAVHLCAFIVWQLCWIHPFPDGNGRTGRALAQMIFGIRNGGSLSTQKSLMEQLTDNRKLYISNLESAHRIFFQTRSIEKALGPLEQWFRELLSEQLTSSF
jgi:Fic family protein